MIDPMRSKLPPFAYRERTRHGKWVTYFRRGKGARTRLPDFGTPEFDAAYQAALTTTSHSAPSRARRGSLQWLVDQFKESADWKQRAPATRKQWGLILAGMTERSNNPDYRAITREKIQRGLDRRADTPAAANNFLKTNRALWRWAVRAGYVATNPAADVDKLRYKTDGFPAWDLGDVEQFRKVHSVGTRARLALELILLSGLRRSDIVAAGRQHLRDDVLTMRTVKTGAIISVRLPRMLVDLIEATDTGDMTFLATDRGTAFTVESFGNWFRKQCRAAGIKKSAHGLRKLSATLAAEGGASEHELMSQYGWRKVEQAAEYTRAVNRQKLGVRTSEIVARQIGLGSDPQQKTAGDEK